MQTVAALRTAMTTSQLVVHYQPKIDPDTGQVNSVEALVRRNHPARSPLPPTFWAWSRNLGRCPD